jgi:hypothetical protein
MAQTVGEFDTPIVDTASGTQYIARVCGRERDDGLWEGWIEFVNRSTGAVLRTVRETTQPNLTDLKYWATGLTPVYLEGALARTLNPPRPTTPPIVSPPHFDGPAQRRAAEHSWPESVLNPFSVYEKSPDLLARELTALRAWHLRKIIRDYSLVAEDEVQLERLTEPELGALILQRVRELQA